MNKDIDLRWKTGEYYYDNYVPKLKDDVSQWVRDSYNNYRKEIQEITKEGKIGAFIKYLIQK